ncbi:MAG: transglycosylase SLT domain-containing protein [Aristaeellaceae bacterium]
MQQPQTPIQRHRRTERQQQESAAIPAAVHSAMPQQPSVTPAPPVTAYQRTPRSTRSTASGQVETPVARMAPPPLSAQQDAPPAMARPRRPAAVQEKPRKPGYRMPWRVTACIVALVFLSMALLAAQNLMLAYLTQRQQERDAAYQAVVDAHPIYYTDLIDLYAGEYNLRPAFVAAIILNESSFRTDAESNVGARGLMQLMPDTAEWIAGKLDVSGYSFERMYDAQSNIRFGTWYLNYLSRLFRGDPVAVACAYHAGQSTVASWLSDRSISPDGITLPLDKLPDGPTKTYARRVTQDYAIYDALYFHVFNQDAETDGSTAAVSVSAALSARR